MINTYNESSLHKTLKTMFCPEKGMTEAPVSHFICDILCEDGSIIEIQTANLAQLRLKLEKLLPKHNIKLIYPISKNTLVTTLNEDGSTKRTRKSPKHGTFFQIFREITSLTAFASNPKLSLLIIYIESEVIKIDDKKGKSRYKNPRIADRKLIKILDTKEFKTLQELSFEILKKLPDEFTNKDIKALGAKEYASYTSLFLKKLELITVIGREKRFIRYAKNKKTQ